MTYREPMLVFAHQSITAFLCDGLVVFANSGKVNKESGCHVDPSGVDPVGPILHMAALEVRIDLEHKTASRAVRKVKVVYAEIIVIPEKPQRSLGDLDVQVFVPWHNLLIPPPAEQGTVHDPRLNADVRHSLKIRPDHDAKIVTSLLVGNRLVGKSGMITLISPSNLHIEVKEERGDESGVPTVIMVTDTRLPYIEKEDGLVVI